MKSLRSIFTFVLIGGAFVFTGYTFYNYTLNPCDRPLEYAIGRFDTEFGVSQEEFKSKIFEAESIWEEAIGKDIFSYNPGASFKINLIYDERQKSTMQKQRVESGLTASEDVFRTLDAEFNSMKKAYEEEVASHDNDIVAFEKRQKEYQAKVEFWNAKGGAPKHEYEALQAEAQSLNAEMVRLNQGAVSLNTEAKNLNTLLEKRNKAATEYNSVAGEYNKKYGHGLEFNQAEYVGNPSSRGDGQINVYQFGNANDLRVALTHELGHALGMNHVENPKSIMYYLTGTNTANGGVPTEEDLAELKKVCKIK